MGALILSIVVSAALSGLLSWLVARNSSRRAKLELYQALEAAKLVELTYDAKGNPLITIRGTGGITLPPPGPHGEGKSS